MKKLFILSLLGLVACQPDNPQPNTTNNGSGSGNTSDTTSIGNTGSSGGTPSNSLPCENIPWNENITYGSVTDIDGNEYKTVTIGNQEWMAENLKTTHYNNGDEIPNLADPTEWENISTGAYCWYLEVDDNGDTISYKNCYGALYNWYTIEDSRNMCPSGWHVPSDNEWDVLKNYLVTNGHSVSEGIALKSTSEWNDYNGQSGNGNDDYGFRGLPGGSRYFNGTFDFIEKGADWWSSNEDVTNNNMSSWSRYISNEFDRVYKSSAGKGNGFSVRCLRD